METPKIRFTVTLEGPDDALFSEACLLLHKEKGHAHSRAEAFREILRQFVASKKTAQ
jgi:hypothetical protein